MTGGTKDDQKGKKDKKDSGMKKTKKDKGKKKDKKDRADTSSDENAVGEQAVPEAVAVEV